MLQAELQAVLRLVESLTGQFDEVVAASRDSNADDEHDPEGATIGFERAQLSALLTAAHRRRADVEAALTPSATAGTASAPPAQRRSALSASQPARRPARASTARRAGAEAGKHPGHGLCRSCDKS